jgi:hypothetical protein
VFADDPAGNRSTGQSNGNMIIMSSGMTNAKRWSERGAGVWLQPAASSADLIGSTNWNVAPFLPSDDAVSAPP